MKALKQCLGYSRCSIYVCLMNEQGRDHGGGLEKTPNLTIIDLVVVVDVVVLLLTSP